MLRISSLALAGFLAMFAAACSSATDPSTPGDGEVGPYAGEGTGSGGTTGAVTPPPTWSEAYSLIEGCAGCHSPKGGPPGALDLSSKDKAYDVLVGKGSVLKACGGGDRVLVKPGDPEGSLLVQKLAGIQDCGDAMPRGPNAQPYPADKLAVLRAWIAAGAKNDG